MYKHNDHNHISYLKVNMQGWLFNVFRPFVWLDIVEYKSIL